jgi:hypothetical protein
VSWWRAWLNRAERPSDEDGSRPPTAEPDERERETRHIRDAERRRLRRLLRRREDLQYDLSQAHQALETDNRWTERIEQLDAATEQAAADLEHLQPTVRASPYPQLEPAPVEIAEVRTADPASVMLRAGNTTVNYREEPDWAERGHQIALPQLQRVSGDVDALLPASFGGEPRQEMLEHLRHSFATLANDALELAAAGEELPRLTLADLTRPCPDCGGWLDHKGRCPSCTELRWRREQIQTNLRRFRKERSELLHDLERFRDRLPIIERQIAETEADIEELRAKGVEPA